MSYTLRPAQTQGGPQQIPHDGLARSLSKQQILVIIFLRSEPGGLGWPTKIKPTKTQRNSIS